MKIICKLILLYVETEKTANVRVQGAEYVLQALEHLCYTKSARKGGNNMKTIAKFFLAVVIVAQLGTSVPVLATAQEPAAKPDFIAFGQGVSGRGVIDKSSDKNLQGNTVPMKNEYTARGNPWGA